MPDYTQTHSIGDRSATYIPSFSPVLGGSYNRGGLTNEATHGYWWGSEASNGARRHGLSYDSSVIYSSNGHTRYSGTYIRCVQKS